MNISNEIKKQRSRLGISQETLAEMIYVSRQTISNWENGRSYPDVYNLVLLSKTFQITIDQLVKGDLIEMEKVIKKDDIKKMKKYGTLMPIGFAVATILFALSWHLSFIPGIILAILVYLVAFYFSTKVERIKKQYEVQTYIEIVAFMKGEHLDEISKARESGKAFYQKIFLTITSMILAMAIVTITLLLLALFR